MTRPPPALSSPPSPTRVRIWRPLAFLGVTLVALASLPLVQALRIEDIEKEIATVLNPARAHVQEMAILQAREMSRFQGYLLTGQANLRFRYETLLQQEDTVYRALSGLVETTGLEIREPLARLYASSRQWRVGHQGALADDVGRVEYLAFLTQEQRRYDDMLAASRELDDAIARQVADGRARMDAARLRQVWINLLLVGLAVGGTVTLGVVGGRQRRLAAEADSRRADALAARRAMEAVLEATGDGVVGVDLEGRCTTLNRAGCELLGASEMDAQGRDLHALLHGRAPAGEAHEPGECRLLAAVGTGARADNGDDVVWRRDGRSFPARWEVRPLVDGREVRGAVVTFADVTRVRQAEQALRRDVRVREEVVETVSHDLRNPLGTIAAAADLLAELDLSPENKREQLDIIRRSAARMTHLIEDLLDVSRLEAGKVILSPAPVDVAELVADVERVAGARAREKGLRLTVRIDDDIPPVMAERVRLEQALANLVGNALKFTDPGGEVTVAAGVRADEVVVEVADSGPGIAPGDLEHLFDRFWQAGRSGAGGAGLGLAIVKGVVEAHGGHVEVDSEPGRGSTFRMRLPAGDEAPTTA